MQLITNLPQYIGKLVGYGTGGVKGYWNLK